MSRIPFDPDVIERLAVILTKNGLSEIEVGDGESRLRLSRVGAGAVDPPIAVVPPLPFAAAVLPEDPPPPAGTVPSPMVGIAYLSAEPGSPPFVTLGQTVSVGQTLLLIEAMKTFNQIKAPKTGVVTHVLVASGQPVEYGQPLVVIG